MPSASDGEVQLVAGAEHALAHDAHLPVALDPAVAGQDRAGQRHRYPLAGRDVRRAADDLERLAAVADRDAWSATGGRRGVLLDGQQLADDHVRASRSPHPSMPLTSMPSSVSRSASCSGVRSTST